MNEWISVKDRLPDDDEIVIVFKKMVSEDNNVLLVFKTVDTEYDDLEHVKLMRGYMVKLLIQCKGSRISHWMPLPEPPNEG